MSNSAGSISSVDSSAPRHSTVSAPFEATIKVLRTIGYGLLLLSILDVAAMVIPFQFKDPLWEFQRFGQLVERAAVPLIALTMIFFQENALRNSGEWLLVKLLSWSSLLTGVIFVLLVPIALSNAQRINIANTEQLSAQYSQQQSQAVELEEQLNTLRADELAAFFASQGEASEDVSPSQLKENVLADLADSKSQLATDFETAKSSRRLSLLTDAVKWIAGALISAILFVYLWVLTPWARVRRVARKGRSSLS